jgi:allantoicase
MDYDTTASGILMPKQDLRVAGLWTGEIVRDGKIIDSWEQPNLVTNEGLDALLNIMFAGSTQITTWYIAPFEGNYTPVATVTAATITAASTECTAYDEATRVAYVEAAASSQSITNSASKATFTFNATKTIYGAFLVSASAKSATSGTLFSAARFGSSKSVVDDDQLLLTYTFTASSV